MTATNAAILKRSFVMAVPTWISKRATCLTCRAVSYELERELIPHGLHVFGGRMSRRTRRSGQRHARCATPDLQRADIEARLEANDELVRY